MAHIHTPMERAQSHDSRLIYTHLQRKDKLMTHIYTFTEGAQSHDSYTQTYGESTKS